VKLKIASAGLLTLLFGCFTVQFSQPVLQASQTNAHTMTNYGSIVPRIGIFFEYGAESGNLDAWDEVGISPGGTWCSHSPASGTKVDDTHARTGTKSMYLYQHAPPKDNPCRRVTQKWAQNKLGISPRTEFYFSWWVYFDNSIWGIMDEYVGSWGALGSVGLYWGYDSAPVGKWTWQAGVSIKYYGYNRRLKASTSFAYPSGNEYAPSAYYQYNENSDFYINEDFPDQWVHFQIYYKQAYNSQGAAKVWINNTLILDESGLKNEPRDFPEWNSKNCEWAVNEYPRMVIKLYGGSTSKPSSPSTDCNEMWVWVDDIVASDKKVPENYGVAQ